MEKANSINMKEIRLLRGCNTPADERFQLIRAPAARNNVPETRVWHRSHLSGLTKSGQGYKKLSYRRVTARCVLSVVILPITAQQCRNYLYDKSWPNRRYEVGGSVGGNVSYTNRRRSSCVYHLYTDDLLWRNFLSPQCRNCSRDPNHTHLGNTHSSQD